MTQLAMANVQLGEIAPDFSLIGHDGKTYSLDQYKGQYVVLEWYNKDCPFVKKHYSVKNMQKIQEQILSDKKVKVAWLSIVSSAEGKQGHLTQTEAKNERILSGMKSTALLLDKDGKVGKSYGAKTTPHMFIINTEGKVAYMGAIDSDSSADSASIASATNYIISFFTDIKNQVAVQTPSTKPYGCAVKY